MKLRKILSGHIVRKKSETIPAIHLSYSLLVYKINPSIWPWRLSVQMGKRLGCSLGTRYNMWDSGKIKLTFVSGPVLGLDLPETIIQGDSALHMVFYHLLSIALSSAQLFLS